LRKNKLSGKVRKRKLPKLKKISQIALQETNPSSIFGWLGFVLFETNVNKEVRARSPVFVLGGVCLKALVNNSRLRRKTGFFF
jgi:hypothetical protein